MVRVFSFKVNGSCVTDRCALISALDLSTHGRLFFGGVFPSCCVCSEGGVEGLQVALLARLEVAVAPLAVGLGAAGGVASQSPLDCVLPGSAPLRPAVQ
jgi:hypothetical protein